MISQRFKIVSDTITPQITQVKAKVEDPSGVLPILGMELVRQIREEISTGGHGDWPPLKSRSGTPLYKTGILRRSFTFHLININTVEVGSSVPYARWHQHGTSPYVIEPKTAKTLRFMVGGRGVFARRVNHPGLPKRPPIRTPKPQNEVEIIERMVLDYYLEGVN